MSARLTPSPARFRVSCECATRKIGDETIVVPVRARAADLESIYTLNEAGSAIWALLDGERSVAEIAKALSDEFEVPEGAALEDVNRFLSTLAEAGLVEPLPGEGR